MKTLKEKLLNHCKATLRRKIELIAFTMDEINGSMENETKSSLGDKHETSRARMQSELEKLSWQMDELKGQNELLNKIDLAVSTDKISNQNLVRSNKGLFFLAIPLGKVDLDGTSVFVISSVSPLGKKLIGLKPRDEITMNEVLYKIEEIL
jgi:hypothetical protein